MEFGRPTFTSSQPIRIRSMTSAQKLWCDWKKAQAAGALSDYRHKPLLSQEVFKAIKPVYNDLGRDELFNRCLGGFTQNSNESFNAAVWNLASKAYSSGKKVSNIATDIAICNFKDGLKNVWRIMQVLEIKIGAQYHNFCVESDSQRIQYA